MTTHRIDYRSARAAQPRALVRMADRMMSRLDLARPGLAGWSTRGPLFIGMGASHAAAALPVWMLNAAGIPAGREIAAEVLVPTGIAVGVSQSGRSPETVEALARWAPARRWALTNIAENPLAASVAADQALDLGGEQDSYASTIGYTGTLVGLAMMARVASGASPAQARAEWVGIDELLERIETQAAPAIEALLGRTADVAAADVVASGGDRSASEAGALLLREVSRIPAAASATRNYLHGEMEAAGSTVHLIVGDERELRLADTLAAAGHPTLLVTETDIDGGPDLFVVRLPHTGSPAVRAVLATATLQRLAQAYADLRGVAIEDFVFSPDDTKITIPDEPDRPTAVAPS